MRDFWLEQWRRCGVVFHMIGKKEWAIAEGDMPSGGAGEGDHALVSHETACILNPGDEDTRVEIKVFFGDREPAGPYRTVVPARRTLHLRFNDLDDTEPVPRDIDYAPVIRANQPIVVQHTRLGLALLSTTG